MPWLVIVLPPVPGLIVALIVIVTLPAAGTEPFQVTVLVPIVGDRRPGRGGGADQGETRRQHVGELVAGVVGWPTAPALVSVTV